MAKMRYSSSCCRT